MPDTLYDLSLEAVTATQLIEDPTLTNKMELAGTRILVRGQFVEDGVAAIMELTPTGELHAKNFVEQ